MKMTNKDNLMILDAVHSRIVDKFFGNDWSSGLDNVLDLVACITADGDYRVPDGSSSVKYRLAELDSFVDELAFLRKVLSNVEQVKPKAEKKAKKAKKK